MGCMMPQKHEDPKTRVNKNDKAIAELKLTRDKVKNYLKKLESSIDSCKSAVKECIRSKQKDKAMLALRKQKYLSKNLETGRGELLNLETLILNVENAQIQKNVYEALERGNEFLKSLNQQLTLNDVEKLMEETQDAIEYQQQIGEALAQQGIKEDDNDLLEEFEKLDQAEALEFEVPSVPQKIKENEKKIEKAEEENQKIAKKQLDYA